MLTASLVFFTRAISSGSALTSLAASMWTRFICPDPIAFQIGSALALIGGFAHRLRHRVRHGGDTRVVQKVPVLEHGKLIGITNKVGNICHEF
jgi:hypothetical protein